MKLSYKDIQQIEKWELVKAMKEKNIKNFAQLATVTGVDEAIISKWVNGKVIISKKSFDKINSTLKTW